MLLLFQKLPEIVMKWKKCVTNLCFKYVLTPILTQSNKQRIRFLNFTKNSCQELAKIVKFIL